MAWLTRIIAEMAVSWQALGCCQAVFAEKSWWVQQASNFSNSNRRTFSARNKKMQQIQLNTRLMVSRIF
jgi:ribose 1,5-bisphosphokinase PhnN